MGSPGGQDGARSPSLGFICLQKGCSEAGGPRKPLEQGITLGSRLSQLLPWHNPFSCINPEPGGWKSAAARHRRPAGEKLPGTFQAVNDLISLSGRSTRGGPAEPQP